jgi:hypothetical protein
VWEICEVSRFKNSTKPRRKRKVFGLPVPGSNPTFWCVNTGLRLFAVRRVFAGWAVYVPESDPFEPPVRVAMVLPEPQPPELELDVPARLAAIARAAACSVRGR